ncbi:NPCBM/NEW2 domain-containing protein [Deinococcus sp. Arct2-2]|uniref:NPCBM/NEW2 domain-containing protein n=1 Tax=Deinococcus sp. Arct2-2 TaxID=2568653 RepID=UPI001F0DBF17|nr:NPCBM/NEW2 domain-containing protein [Deinococcus sp. Arct2-2]
MSARLLPALTLSLLLLGCGQLQTPVEVDPYANGQSYPWQHTGTLAPQSLTPGTNTLQYETASFARNSWGPVERNASNGEQKAGDGTPLTLNGKMYAQGYGVHAGSELRFSLAGTGGAQCNNFTADIGIDDEVGSRGSVVLQVYGDGVKLYDSGVLTGDSATKRVNVGVVGRQELRLIVTDAGNGISFDHADWADPRLECATTAPEAGSVDTSWTAHSVAPNFIKAVLEPDLNVLVGGLFVRQPDSKRLVITNTTSGKFEVARRFADGTLDTGYGQGGRIVTDFAPGQTDNPNDSRQSYGANDALLQPDGKLVVVGTGGNQLSDFAVARYTAQGQLDTTFGQSGVVFTSLEPLKDPQPNDPAVFSTDRAQRVFLGPDGTLVVLGTYEQPTLPRIAGAIVRYTANGTLDTTLLKGLRPIGMTQVSSDATGGPLTLAVEPNGDMIFGANGRATTYVGVLVQRIRRSGLYGPSTPNFFLGPQSPHANVITDLTLQPDGTILVGGRADLGGVLPSGVLVRLNPDLSFDKTFGPDGTGQVVTAAESGGIQKILLQPDGKIVAVENTVRRFWP